MDDQELVNRINELAEHEHHLEEAHVGQGLSPEEEERLRTIEVALDQCWDLLRQRRARRQAGQDPNEAQERPAPVVERYQQ
ncbi:MAG TPA: DUF2630 family protein [Acidimicrobiales bacterium]|nr:DUF2630 family protein [Acidimicrobiales bacterium]